MRTLRACLSAAVVLIASSLPAFAGGGSIISPVSGAISIATGSASQCLRTDSTGSDFYAGPGCNGGNTSGATASQLVVLGTATIVRSGDGSALRWGDGTRIGGLNNQATVGTGVGAISNDALFFFSNNVVRGGITALGHLAIMDSTMWALTNQGAVDARVYITTGTNSTTGGLLIEGNFSRPLRVGTTFILYSDQLYRGVPETAASSTTFNADVLANFIKITSASFSQSFTAGPGSTATFQYVQVASETNRGNLIVVGTMSVQGAGVQFSGVTGVAPFRVGSAPTNSSYAQSITATAATLLSLESTSASDAYINLYANNTNGRNWLIGAAATDANRGNGYLWIYDATASADRLSIDPSGNIIIANQSVTASTITVTGYFVPAVRTKAQHDTDAIVYVGSINTCSDCTVAYSICVATGTTASQWRAQGTTNGCGSGN